MNIEKGTASVGWNFDNSYAELPSVFYTKMEPTPVREPKLAVLNDRLAALLGLDTQRLRSEEGAAVFAGNAVPEGAAPLAQAYAGHQFGHFTMLGDGRALLLGEQITPTGERFDIQLKGSGPTPYSRRGDGRAALGPMLREYIISEAMHALGIPTTRSLAVATTGETIYRETELAGAVLTRVAASHIRVGTFQYAAARDSVEDLRRLADYTIRRHFPDVDVNGEADGDGKANADVDTNSAAGVGSGAHVSEVGAGANRYLLLLREVIKRQASLIAKWQLVGFVHGVMNTDNMALSGETIDYGPCAFMDVYDPATVFSSIDKNGRYAYGNQPGIGGWNLARFAETLLPLLHEDEEKAVEIAQEALGDYSLQYRGHWMAGMRAKLGIFNEEPEDEAMIEQLLGLMQRYKADYTNTFSALASSKPEAGVDTGANGEGGQVGGTEQTRRTAQIAPAQTAQTGEVGSLVLETPEFAEWHANWQARLGRQQEPMAESLDLMRRSNPAVIPRNDRVEEALEAAAQSGDYSVMDKLLDALSRPYDDTVKRDVCYIQTSQDGRPYRTFCGT